MADKKRPIDEMRDSAFQFTIGDGSERDSINAMITISDRLLMVTASQTLEIFLPDQIDPDRTNPAVPHSQICLLKHGATSELLGRTFLLCDELIKPEHLASHIQRDALMECALGLASNLASIKEKTEHFLELQNDALEQIPEASERLKSQNIFAVPKVEGAETTCKEVFVTSKHVLQSILDMAGIFFGEDLNPGFFSNIQEFSTKKYGQNDEFSVFLQETHSFREFLREVRNSFEHPKQNKHAVIRNVRINKEAEIELPTFEHVHPKWQQPEVRLDFLFESINKNLIEFSENMILHMVKKTMTGKFAGSETQLIWRPDGLTDKPHVRYGYGIYLGGELHPLG